MVRAEYAMVRIRQFPSHPARSRAGTDAGDVAIRRRHRRRVCRDVEVRSVALPPAPLHLFDGGDGHEASRHHLGTPVTTYMARTRSVDLPPAAAWYDFWAGAQSAGGTTVTANAAFDAIPVYVRAGSIVPVGPELQYVAEKPADPITLYVYAGADGTFTLYEDQGTTYDYENGAFATIPLTWVDATKTLTIGAQTGSFAGMLTQRTFQVVLVGPNKPVGFSFPPTADKSVT